MALLLIQERKPKLIFMRIFRSRYFLSLIGRPFLAFLFTVTLSACQSTKNYVKPAFNQVSHAQDHKFCVQVASQPRQNPAVPSVPCYGCPIYGTLAMSAFRIIVNGVTGTTVDETSYDHCMRNNGYQAIPMTEEQWEEFNKLQTVDKRREYLLELLQNTQQGP